MKDDEGHRAFVKEQGASASQMAVARSLDTIFYLLDMTAEAIDAVSAYTQVKNNMRSHF